MRNAIVMASDERLFPAAAFAAERMAALNNRTDTDIIIFTDSEAELAAARTRFAPYQVHPIRRPAAAPAQMDRPTYFRLFIPSVLQAGYRRLLYLDVDTWMENAAPFELFDLDMRGCVFAAVRDACIAYVPASRELAATVGADQRKYFNAGVLLIDIDGYRREHILARSIEVVQKGEVPLGLSDQTVLNFLLKGGWLELSPRFNMLTPVWQSPTVRRVLPPAIVHFVGDSKPWHGPRFTTPHPARAAMERYFPRSPWPGFLPSFYNLKDALSLIRTGPPSVYDPRFDFERFPGRFEFANYLQTTDFADIARQPSGPPVEAG